MKSRTVVLNKIPSIFKNVNLSNEVVIDSAIPAKEGVFVVVQVQESIGKKNDLDFANGRLGKAVKGDIIPCVLGYRKASVEFAGIVPRSVKVGDFLHLLCESGLVGSVSGVYESWGEPMKVKILGAITDKSGKTLYLKSFALSKIKPSKKKIPVIAFLGTRMDCGKTTMACKVIYHFKKSGKKVAAAKVTGVAFTQDLYKLKEHGANPVVDFVDMGLPSTCNGNVDEIVDACSNLLNHLKEKDPDFVVMEFGDSVIGEYHVLDILKNKAIKDQISFTILAANDFAGVYGAKLILERLGLNIDLLTGPVVNSQVGVDLVKKYFDLNAESNQYAISKTTKLIKEKIKEFYEIKK